MDDLLILCNLNHDKCKIFMSFLSDISHNVIAWNIYQGFLFEMYTINSTIYWITVIKKTKTAAVISI